jgi:hypothetical protein
MLDWVEPVSLASQGQPLDAMIANPLTFQEVATRISKRTCGSIRNEWGSWTYLVHRRFFKPIRPFQGMWVLSRKQLDAYMASPF